MPSLGRVVPPMILVLAALAAAHGRTLAWGGADAPDGTRYKVSPVGISQVLKPHQTVSPTVNCRWGEPAPPCTVADAADARRLSLVALLVLLGAGLAIGAALATAAGPRAAAWITPACGSAALLCFGVAPWLFVSSAQRALAVLAPLSLGIGGTLGTLELSVAAALVAGCVGGQLARLAMRRPAATIALLVAGAVPAVMFLAMFPFPHGLGFLVPALALGFVAGRLD